MSAIKLAVSAVSALNREKPHSSITDWIDILTSPNYDDEAYDGIPEIVDSIGLQPTGPAEASRAIRKKLKHGDAHQQYRALVILKALVENGGHKFQTTFADGQLTDAIKHLANDAGTDQKVKKKLLAVLSSWNSQFKDDPSMTVVVGLYKQCRPVPNRRSAIPSRQESGGLMNGSADADFGKRTSDFDIAAAAELEKKRKDKEEKELAKKRAKEEAKAKRAEEEARRKKPRTKRAPFNFETEKPQILTAIANASQATNNLVNSITLVNSEKDSVTANERVQECLGKAKVARKPIVRYIQLVENEDVIGTLIETNERIIAALEIYDKLANPPTDESPTDTAADMQRAMDKLHISQPRQQSELEKLQERQRVAVERAKQRQADSQYDDDDETSPARRGYVHPDLQDLSFGSLGNDQRGLPPPMRPSSGYDEQYSDRDEDWDTQRGSLSDFSDYESEEEHSHPVAGSSHAYGNNTKRLVDVEDPFADPFAG